MFKMNLYKKFLFWQLSKIKYGMIKIDNQNHLYQFGMQNNDGLSCNIKVNSPRAYKKILFGGSIGAAESYMDGSWDCDNLTNLFLIFIKNYSVMNKIEGFCYSIKNIYNKLTNKKFKNTKKQSQKNISHHYDLSNELYQVFLGQDMMYSAALFENKDLTLEQASIAKLERICQKLQLKEDDHVLEIGSGWGGFAIYAAKQYYCKVTTITISKQQYEYTKAKITENNLEDKITLLFKDYRDVEGQFDKLVSIEMVEAVGAEYFPAYFKKCSSLLKPGGLCLLQAITIADKFYPTYKNEVDFIQKYIFPGGCLPSLLEMQKITSKYTNFQLLDAYSFGQDYAKTLAIWDKRFLDNQQQVLALGFDQRFIRMWHYYLMYCQAGFLQNHINVFQLLYQKAEHF